MSKENLKQIYLTEEEASLIEIIRKVLWGSVEVIIKRGNIKVIKKIVQVFDFERDRNNKSQGGV